MVECEIRMERRIREEEKQGQDNYCPNDVGASEMNGGGVDEKR